MVVCLSSQALREELVFAERRAEEEHLAHNATRIVIYVPSLNV